MAVLEFLFQSRLSTALTAVVLAVCSLALSAWWMSREKPARGRRRRR